MEGSTIWTGATTFILFEGHARHAHWPGGLARNYMDDVLIASYTEKEHLDHITQVFESFRKFKMKLKLAKCEFG